MPEFNYSQFLKATLTRAELDLLNDSNEIPLNSKRLDYIRSFFLMPEIFAKVEKSVDPMWIANMVFVNCYKTYF